MNLFIAYWDFPVSSNAIFLHFSLHSLQTARWVTKLKNLLGFLILSVSPEADYRK